MEVADRMKKLDDLENTITHLQYQGEFAPRYYEHTAQMKKLNEAKDALAKGESYNNISGDQLAAQIQTAQVILDKNKTDLDAEYRERVQGVDAPGRKALEDRLPDIADKFNDYAKGWGDVGREFGFTDVELSNNADFRWYNMAQEVIETREKLAAYESKIEAARAKRRGKKVASTGSPSKATPRSQKKTEAKSTNFEELNERINRGDTEARGELIQQLFG